MRGHLIRGLDHHGAIGRVHRGTIDPHVVGEFVPHAIQGEERNGHGIDDLVTVQARPGQGDAIIVRACEVDILPPLKRGVGRRNEGTAEKGCTQQRC